MENAKEVKTALPDGKTGIEWRMKEKPCLNHWYRIKGKELDFWRINKDFYSPETKITYYKIVEYYNGDILYCGRTLKQIRMIMRDETYRMVI